MLVPVHVLRPLGLWGSVWPVSRYVRSCSFLGGGGSVPAVRGAVLAHRGADVHAKY